MKRDIFRRGPRFTHQFGSLEEVNGPFFGPSCFELPVPERIDELGQIGGTPGSRRGRPVEIHEFGERFYAPERSAVTKPSGSNASLNGPVLDLAEAVGRPIPASTKRRFGPLKTDK
jgi:hypothetical protein